MQCEAGEDECSEALPADVSPERCDRNHRDRRDANAADDDRQRERQLDAYELLTRRHPETVCGVDLRGIDAADTGGDVPHEHELRVRDERNEYRSDAEAKCADQQREEREARNRVDRAEQTEEKRRGSRAADDDECERKRGRERNEQRGGNDECMVLRKREHARGVGCEVGHRLPMIVARTAAKSIVPIGCSASTTTTRSAPPSNTLRTVCKSACASMRTPSTATVDRCTASRARNIVNRRITSPAPMSSATYAFAGVTSICSGVAICSRRPSFMTTIRSARCSASSTSWVTKSVVVPSSRTMRTSSRWSWARTIASTAPNGSSIRSARGCAAIARATPTRCASPPERSRG